MAIDMALEQAARENVVDIPAIVTKMRKQRMKMVQNLVRNFNCSFYIFWVETIVSCAYTNIRGDGLEIYNIRGDGLEISN